MSTKQHLLFNPSITSYFTAHFKCFSISHDNHALGLKSILLMQSINITLYMTFLNAQQNFLATHASFNSSTSLITFMSSDAKQIYVTRIALN